MAGADRLGAPHRGRDQLLVVAGAADEPDSGRLAEADPEAQRRRTADQRLVNVLDRLDEVRLRKDQVRVVRHLEPDGRDVHAAIVPGAPAERIRAGCATVIGDDYRHQRAPYIPERFSGIVRDVRDRGW